MKINLMTYSSYSLFFIRAGVNVKIFRANKWEAEGARAFLVYHCLWGKSCNRKQAYTPFAPYSCGDVKRYDSAPIIIHARECSKWVWRGDQHPPKFLKKAPPPSEEGDRENGVSIWQCRRGKARADTLLRGSEGRSRAFWGMKESR